MAHPIPRRDHGAALTAFIAGFAVMNTEIAAGRLFAPYYGTSTTTWALLIGSIMMSLAAGGVAGGWLSRRGRPEPWLARLLLVAAALSALLPRLAPHLMAGSLGQLRAGHLAPLAGAAAAAAGLLFLPVACLGAISPLLLHVAGRRVERTLAHDLGTVAGRLYAAGTLGGLAGTFAAGLVFIPWLGTSRTIDLGSLLLALAALVMALRSRRRPAGLVAALAAALFATCLRRPILPPASAGRLVHAAESRLNTIAVVDVGDERQLLVNDGFAVQSVAHRDGRLPLRDVWAYYALAPSWAAKPAVESVLLLGMGGGTAAEIYRRLYPAAHITGVEIDPAMVSAGASYLGHDLSEVDVRIEDARTFAAEAAVSDPGRHDVIILDAFQFPYIPFQLTTREFFLDLADCLAPGGVLMVNVGRYGEHRDVVHAVSLTLSSVFPHVQSADAPNRSNTILVATRHRPDQAVGLAGLRGTPAASPLAPLAPLARSMRPASWPESAPLLTDDHAPVEWLTDLAVWSSL